jgi:hypothetical protein
MAYRIRRLLVAVPALVAGLSGCATYEEPSDGAMAHLTIVGAAGSVEIGYAGQCGELKTVSTQLVGGFKIRGNTDVYLTTSPHSLGAGTCTGSLTFHAQAGARYHLYATLVQGEGCTARLMKQVPGTGTIVEDRSLRILERKRCLPWQG